MNGDRKSIDTYLSNDDIWLGAICREAEKREPRSVTITGFVLIKRSLWGYGCSSFKNEPEAEDTDMNKETCTYAEEDISCNIEDGTF